MAIAAMRVPTIFTAVDRFSDVVSRMTAKTSAFGATAEAAAMRTSRSFNRAGTNMLTAGVGMAVGIGYAVNEAVKFEKAMANISTTIDSTPQSMRVMSDSILKISKDIPVSISELTSGMYDVVSVGIEGTANQLSVLKNSSLLAVAGLGTVKEAVDITTSSINAFGKEAGSTAEVTNKLFKAVKYGKTTVAGISESFGAFAAIMKNSGVTLDEYLGSAAALTTTGMTMSRAQTQISSATIALIKPNLTMAKIYKRLGVKDVPTFIKQSGGLVGALQKVNDVSQSMGLKLGSVMGRKEGLSALLSLLGAQRGKFGEIMKDMASGTNVLGEAFSKQEATLATKIQLMKNNLTILAIRIGDVLIPRVKDLVDSILPVVQSVTAWAQRNEGLANTLLTAAKWLLILGVASKITAFLFYGLAKAIAFVKWAQIAYTTVVELCTVATYLAASGQATFAASLWAVASGLMAAYWPVLLVVAALGGLAYAFSNSKKSTDFMVNGQIMALGKSNRAWENNTNTIKVELAKQRSAVESVFKRTNLQVNSPYDKNNLYDLGANGIGMINQNEKNKYLSQFKGLDARTLANISKNYDMSMQSATKKYSLPSSENAPATNLAGNLYSKDVEMMDFMKANEKRFNLDLNVTAPDGYGVEAGKAPEGITVKTTKNQGNR
jgi:TP901 family phage tail tape measure protein